MSSLNALDPTWIAWKEPGKEEPNLLKQVFNAEGPVQKHALKAALNIHYRQHPGPSFKLARSCCFLLLIRVLRAVHILHLMFL